MTTPASTISGKLTIGAAAPKFKLNAYPSGQVSLDDFIGKKNVILAFYPKDDTPGCTKEMCSFSEDLSKFEAADTQVLGISCDPVQQHEKFAGKYNLKQHLLADSDGKVGKLYGVVTEGKSTAQRVLFVIDKTGKIRHIYEGMPNNAELLKFIESLKH